MPSHRFAESRATATTSTTAPDVITFRDDAAASTSSSSSSSSSSSDGESSEYDSQLAQIDEEIKRAVEQVEESQACARKLGERETELRGLKERRENVEREKQKSILQNKLDKQLRDLSEITRMTQSLKSKFNDLKRTQKVIRAKLTGTQSSLNQLDSNGDVSSVDAAESSANIVGEVEAMHEAQKALLDHSHELNNKVVSSEIDSVNKNNQKARAQATEQQDV